ncbi:DUF998 domain-containing protein [Nocardia sp. NPDC051832]|uniref:DUF998 domain-containing protein n=1 Tax=Nocardia sp. NPDC051832 TaxID=3155673 RepID=UPI003449B5FF
MMKVSRWCGLLTGPLFIVAFGIEGALREGYNPMRHPVSALSLGPWGWTASITFAVCGVLGLVFAAGLWRAGTVVAALLVGLWAIGLLGLGLFVTDPVSGYPPGVPAVPDTTFHATLHNIFSVLVLLGLTAACFVFAGDRGWLWMGYSLASGLVFGVAFMVAGSGFAQAPNLVDTGGLWQRIAIVAGWTWLTVLAFLSKELSSA